MKIHYFTKQDILDYMVHTNREAAYNLLLLAGPDSFKNYQDYKELENKLAN